MLKGEGVGLRLVLEEDLSLISQWREDEQVGQMFYSLARVAEGALRNWFKSLLNDSTRMRFMIQRLEDGVTVGIVGLEHIDYRNQVAELAGLVIAPEERRRGWGTKAVQTLLRYAFNDLNLHRLYARLYASNRAALCFAERAGLRNEGVARQAIFHNWNYEDVVHMAILREEWQNECSTTSAH